MSGLVATFSEKDIEKDMSKLISNANKKIFSVLSYVGEQFVNDARSTSTYKDQTGNLRSSIGYAISINGKIKKKQISGTSEGQSRANEIANSIAQANPVGFVLIGFAGMEYAAAVESKGYDVISNSVPKASELLRELKKGLGL